LLGLGRWFWGVAQDGNNYGQTALMLAEREGHGEIVRLLREKENTNPCIIMLSAAALQTRNELEAGRVCD